MSIATAQSQQPEHSVVTRICIQTWALIVDAYREVNSKKLFWITLILSLVVVAAFAFVGINERGIWLFGKTIPGVWNTSIIPADQFYKFIFTSIAIPWWLGFLATILALVSACSVFPDLISNGSVDLYLAKPLSRARLFLTKYFLGLTFAAIQVAAFALASFLVIGLRGGSWEWGIFLAIPLVTLFFSYLYCVCVLLGVLTRSSLAALLITILFWGGVFAINATDGILMTFKALAEERLENHQNAMAFNQDLITRNNAMPTTQRSDASEFQRQLDAQQKKLPEFQSDANDLRWWHVLVTLVKSPLPKTGETVGLMNRWLVNPTPFEQAQQAGEKRREERRASRGFRRDPDRIDPGDEGVQERISHEMSSRAAVKIIGTSLGFEVVVVLLAMWIFCRRDY